MNLKGILAREWLLFIGSLTVGMVCTFLIYFMNSADFMSKRIILYDAATKHYKEEQILRTSILEDKKWGSYRKVSDEEIAADTSHPLGTFASFCSNLDDPIKRKKFYDSVSTYFDIGDYQAFQQKVLAPSLSDRLSKFWNHLFSKSYWIQTWLAIAFPFLLIQSVRSIVYSNLYVTQIEKQNHSWVTQNAHT